MRQERKTQLAGRIRVRDTSGQERTVEDMGDFVRVQYQDGSWSPWSRSGGRYLLNEQHVNPTDDDAILEIAATGELLTVIAPLE